MTLLADALTLLPTQPANAFSPPVEIAGWLACLAFLIWIARGVIALTDRITGRKQELSPQPLTVEIAKTLHEQFADKRVFEKHVEENRSRHGQIFNRIEQIREEGRAHTDQSIAEMNVERRGTLERLNGEFVFIRENIAAINRELQIRSKS